MKKYILLIFYSFLFACVLRRSPSIDTTPYVQITNNSSQSHTINIFSDNDEMISITTEKESTSEKYKLKYETQYRVTMNTTTYTFTTSDALTYHTIITFYQDHGFSIEELRFLTITELIITTNDSLTISLL